MKPLRIISTEIGVGETERGTKNLAKALRDAGFEVIPLGSGLSATQVAQAVGQEDVDALYLWCASGCKIEKLKDYFDQYNAAFDGATPIFLCGETPGDELEIEWKGSAPIIFKKDESFSTIVALIKAELKKRSRA